MKTQQRHCRSAKPTVAMSLALAIASAPVLAEEPAKSADEIARELANPAGSLASLNFNLQYQSFKGDLSGAGDQDSWSLVFQPSLPFPVGSEGRRVIFRPAVPLLFDQPLFDARKDGFDKADVNLGDIGFDLVYAGTEMRDKKNGFLWGVGTAGTLPTATDSAVGGNQWRAGPEFFGGIIRSWGLVGALVSNQWNLGGTNDDDYSMLTAQYFYAVGLGKGWQISSSPIITYDWNADSDQALTLPLGLGLAKTTTLGGKPWKFTPLLSPPPWQASSQVLAQITALQVWTRNTPASGRCQDLHKLYLPTNIPVKDNWSVTIYNTQTRSMMQTDQASAGIRSLEGKVKQNADGSFDIYFPPKAPKEQENN